MSNDSGQYGGGQYGGGQYGGQQSGGPQYPPGPQQQYPGPQYPAQQFPPQQFPGQQQQPGGPQWQPQPPRKSRGGLIAVLAVAGVVVIGLIAFFLIGRAGDSETARPTQPQAPSKAPTGNPSGGPTASAGPAGTGPVSCGERTTFLCFPVATVASVSKALAAKGARCVKSKETRDLKCVKGSPASYIEVSLMPDINDAAKLGTFDVLTSSHVAGTNTEGRALVINNLKHSMPTLMAAVLPNEPKTRQDITAWLNKFTEACPAEAVTLDRYKVNCDAPTKFSVVDKQLFTTYTFGLSVDAATAFMPSSPR